MKSQTLEQYLKAAADSDNGQIDHVLRAGFGKDGKVTFYVRPLQGDGETVDFVVRGNALALNMTNDSDVHQGVDSLLATRAPILDQITDLCHAIEKCGASPELTDAVTKASALREPITQLVQQAIGLGLDTGRMSASVSTLEIPANSMTGCAAGSIRSTLDEAVSLGHCAANAANATSSLAELVGMSNDHGAINAMSSMVAAFASKATELLSGEIEVVGQVQISVIGDVDLATTGGVSVTQTI